MTLRVGLTGGIASGKSTVAALLADHGAVLVDADVLAREVVAPGTEGLRQVVASFGRDVVTAEGSLDRAAVGRLVFDDEQARRRLEAIVHPLVHQRAAEVEASAPPGAVVVHDIPLLVEGDPSRLRDFDAVLVVDAPEDLQLRRMVTDRGWTEDEARARIRAQASREERLAVATHVIDNTGTRDDLRERVSEVVAELLGRG